MMRERHASRQRGLALLSVLWVGVALGALAAAMVSLSRGDLDLARTQLVRAEAELAADSAARTAIFALVNNTESPILPDGSVLAWRLPGAEVRVRVTSEHGRIDVNRAAPDLVAALLEGGGAEPGEAERLSAAITDYIDADDLTTPSGAERGDYAAAGLPGPKNAALEHEAELLGVLGMSAGLFRRIRDAVTVHSGRSVPRGAPSHPLVRAALRDDQLAVGGNDPAEPLPPAFDVALGATPEPLRPGPEASRSGLVRIRAEAETEAGARAARIAVVSLRVRGDSAYTIMAWRLGTPELFPPRPPEQQRAQAPRIRSE